MDPVHDYHQRSKHHLDHYAPGPGVLDWATQPDPFRRFDGAEQVDLPLLEGELPARWDDLFRPGAVPPQPLNRDTLAQLLQLCLGLAAWKSYDGNRWALRCNPSSGNLHPTEGYLICPELPRLPPGVYHYRPREHALERRAPAAFDWEDGALLALTGIHWREAWKYGMRAFRYCQHDCGHALAAIAYAAASLGWPARLLADWGDDDIAALVGADRASDFRDAEGEAPEALVWVGPGQVPAKRAVLDRLAGATWSGRAHVLSPAHRDWPDIPRIAAATRRPPDLVAPGRSLPALPVVASASGELVSALIRRRRSAQSFDGAGGIAAAALFRILDAVLPRAGTPPWSLWPGAPCLHLVLFLHRVHGLDPGVYCLARNPDALAELRAAMRPDWLWAPVPGCPAHLPLYLLAPLDARQFAATVSCHQAIAADSAFSLAMLARFDDIDARHPWRYRERYWEAGMIGQVFYLEAEAAGLQGTGIGCYFDDAVHQALGIEDASFQDLYHFTVGTARSDPRLASEPAYAHLAGRPLVAPRRRA